MPPRSPAPLRAIRLPALGLLGLLGLASPTLPACADPPKSTTYQGPPLLFMVTMDTLRRDRADRHMPTLSALLARGLDAPYVLASGCWTYNTMPTLLAGRPMMDMGPEPYALGVRQVSDEEELLAEILAARGYHTFYAVANGLAGGASNLLQGYEVVEEPARVHDHMRHLRTWLRAWEDDGRSWPFFIHLQLMEPHAPYGANLGEGCRAEVESLASACEAATGFDFLEINNYEARILAPGWADGDAEICREAVESAYACALTALDGYVETIQEVLADHGALDHTVQVWGTDHGEQLGPDHYGHNQGEVWDVTRAFLGISGPGVPARVLDEGVSQADLVPTVLELLGIPVVAGPTGRSLLGAGDSELRSFWCEPGRIKSYGWLAPDLSAYVRHDAFTDGVATWSVEHPRVEDSPVVATPATLPADAVAAIEAEKVRLADYCPPE